MEMEYDTHASGLRWMQGVLILAIAFVAGACGDVEPKANGKVDFGWEVAPKGCEQAGVTRVEATLETKNEDVSRTESFECAAGEGTIKGVRPASYEVSTVGIDGNGNEIYDADESKSVTVRSNETASAGSFRLTVKLGSLNVTWSFGERCAVANIETVDVVVFDAETSSEQGSESASCTDEDVSFEELGPGETLLVQVTGKDENGNTTYKGEKEVTLGKGETRDLLVELNEQ